MSDSLNVFDNLIITRFCHNLQHQSRRALQQMVDSSSILVIPRCCLSLLLRQRKHFISIGWIRKNI
eukprot:2842244-Amphidinium_carterae.1